MHRDRIVVITGAAGGIGTVLVDRFLANQDTVVAVDINGTSLASLVQTRDAGSRLVPLRADLSQESDCERLARSAGEVAGRVDVLVHCAGYFPICRFEDMSAQDWRSVIDINLTATFFLTRAILPLMKGRGWGRIINYTSSSIYDGVPGRAHYAAAKAGVVGFSRTIARELGSYGITVNMISPGLTLTPPVLKHFSPQMLENQLTRRAIQRDQVPADLVGATFFLASPESEFMSGQTINVDGGRTML
ncbi:SDR family oxidoreductase [Bradyrhizobium sp. 190]|uniref:SDR family NAD(P)-dependent oxidoreductase n=1 Tax=Bradyrhizobium sp. 190 TaxID=2782658 RepID=UPI001FF78530|nr:SDR family oxidoreductase [Bradyrhizobium sp. 190]MCK1513110.1 SDR family oxidoreductase [Bradyrhizobium sp. 190]